MNEASYQISRIVYATRLRTDGVGSDLTLPPVLFELAMSVSPNALI